MSLKHTCLAAAVTISILAGPRVPADDGKPDQAKSEARPAPSREQAEGLLTEAFQMVPAAAAPPTAPPPAFLPGQVVMVAAVPKQIEGDAMRQIARARARLGDRAGARLAWQAALDTAAEIAYDPGGRAAIPLAIARDQLEAGEREEAIASLRQALRAARSTAVPPGLMMAGGVVLPTTSDPTAGKIDMLRQIARVQCKAGDVAAAREVLGEANAEVRSLARPLDRIGALVKLADADDKLADIGRLAWSLALDAALAESNEFVRARAVEMVLRARVRALQLDEAMATIADRLDGDLKDYAIWVVADAIAASDRPISPPPMARLRELASKARYDQPSKKIKVYRRLAEAHARVGDYDQAYRCIGELQPANNVENFRAIQGRVYVMKAIAEAQLRAGRREAARDTVLAALEAIAPLPDADGEAYFPMADLARIQAEAGDVAGALRTAESVGGSTSRVRIFCEVATAQARQGRPDDARASVRRALEAARRAPNEALWSLDPWQANLPNSRFEGMDPVLPLSALIAPAQARINDLDGAIQTVSGMGSSMWSSYYRNQAVGLIVAVRLDAGDTDGARKAADLLANPGAPAPMIVRADADLDASATPLDGARPGLLERVARRQAEQGDPAVVLGWASSQDPTTRIHMLRGLAAGIAERFDPKVKTSKRADAQGSPRPRPTSP